MSKKKEDKKTVDETVEEVKTDSKKDEVKEEPKKSSKKSSKKSKVKKKKEINVRPKPLIELVEESGIRRKDIIVRLAKNGYLGQFYEEEGKRLIGYPIEPTISEEEFKKIIGE